MWNPRGTLAKPLSCSGQWGCQSASQAAVNFSTNIFLLQPWWCSCFLLLSSGCLHRKNLWGLSGLFLQILAMGTFADYGKVTKRVTFCVLLRSSMHFSNALGNGIQSTSVTLKKKTQHFGDICLSSPSPTWSWAQVCCSLILPAVMVPWGCSRMPLSLTLSRRPDFIYSVSVVP